MFLLASVSFWTVRAQGIVWGYYNLFNIARMPDESVPRFCSRPSSRLHCRCSGGKCAGQTAGPQTQFAAGDAGAAGHGRRFAWRRRKVFGVCL